MNSSKQPEISQEQPEISQELCFGMFSDILKELKSVREELNRVKAAQEENLAFFDNFLFDKSDAAKLLTNKNTQNPVSELTVAKWFKEGLLKVVDDSRPKRTSGYHLRMFCRQFPKKYTLNEV